MKILAIRVEVTPWIQSYTGSFESATTEEMYDMAMVTLEDIGQ